MYMHVPKERRLKLEPSGNKGTFVGYNETLNAFGYTSLVRDILRLVGMSPLMSRKL